jgi:hypothetical protein
MVKFGWLSPVIGNQWSDFQPIVIKQCELILPEITPHFDSVWIADHFYGFDSRSDPFLEAWTTLTWVAAKFPNIDLKKVPINIRYSVIINIISYGLTYFNLIQNPFIIYLLYPISLYLIIERYSKGVMNTIGSIVKLIK